VAWEISALTIGWPPSVQLERRAGHEEALDDLFIFLSDKRLLLYGYGPRSGINDLDDLRTRVDIIREPLRLAVKDVGSKAPIAKWLERLRMACHELINHATEAINTTDETARSSEPSEVVRAVDQLRQAFRLVADHVWAVYELPSARNLAAAIGEDTASPPTAGR
jgi:hypothetical protein